MLYVVQEIRDKTEFGAVLIYPVFFKEASVYTELLVFFGCILFCYVSNASHKYCTLNCWTHP
jgi:hypothetical protein